MWHFFLKRHFHRHASLHKSRRENHRRVVFTQQETIYSRAHLVLTNLLITSLLVLCFSQWFLLFLPPNILLISCHPRLLFWYLLFRYRWAHHLCFLSMNDLSRSSFFDLSIYLSIYLSSIDMHASLHKSRRKSQAGGVYTAGDDLLARTPSTH